MRSWSVVEVKTESMRFLECFIYASTSFSSILFRVQSFYFVTNTWPMFLKLCLRRTNNDQLFLRVPRFFKTSISVIPYSSVFLSLLVKKKMLLLVTCYGSKRETSKRNNRQKQMFLRCVQFVDADTIVLVVCTLVCPLRYVNTSLRYVASIPRVNFSYNRINVLK